MRIRVVIGITAFGVSAWGSSLAETAQKDPCVMLAGSWVPTDTHRIDFRTLPRIPYRHAVVSDVLAEQGRRVNQHNYLAFHAGRFWAMWSDGPGGPIAPNEVPHHDLAGQCVSFATSADGLVWSAIGDLAGKPEKGFGWIARGFWIRDGTMLALASRYKAPAYANKGLQLHAFELVPQGGDVWRHAGLVYDDTLNNFPPKRLANGKWMMSRRDHRRNVHLLFGGVKSFDDWETIPFVAYRESGLEAEEPDWWMLADGRLAALFRDNRRSGYLFRSFSSDNGRTWSRPLRTNFPDATSKFFGLKLIDGRHVLVSNPNPKKRDPMTISVSQDGLVFDRMFYLVGGRHVDYPHAIEQEGFLLVACATLKQTVEVFKIRLEDLDAFKMP
jgi:hypothetical protein